LAGGIQEGEGELPYGCFSGGKHEQLLGARTVIEGHRCHDSAFRGGNRPVAPDEGGLSFDFAGVEDQLYRSIAKLAGGALGMNREAREAEDEGGAGTGQPRMSPMIH
jgi:hypothetical protein